jgi:hypothetical protein
LQTKKLRMKKIVLFIAFLSFVVACSSSDNESATNSDNFDRTALLTNWAENIIIPSYENYQSKVAVLVNNTNSFNANPTTENLQVLRTSWLEAYKAYQKVTAFYIGKAMEINLKETSNTYPTDVTGINANIASGSYDLNLLSQFSKQGFPALDYLINGLATNDVAILAFYTTNDNANNYKQYLVNVTNKLKSSIDVVVADWNGGYKALFIAASGTAVSSSVNTMTNLFVKHLEKDIRTGKLGIPAGLFSSGTKFPEKVEGFYKNDISKELLFIAIQAQEDFFNGKHFNSTTTGSSLKSYLDHVNAVRNGVNLSTIINNQFVAIDAANANLENSFSNQINSDNNKMIAAFDALQQNVIYTKLDMMQALNIPIDYVDGDGD